MKEFTFYPAGICPRKITIQLEDDNTFHQVLFFGGCDGNHKGINAMCRGLKAEEVIERLSGITCGGRNTSCPDQLARGLKKMLEAK